MRRSSGNVATMRARASTIPAAVAIGTGFGVAAMYASMEMRLSLVSPGAAYYVLAAAGIVLALGLILATFPLLRRITGPETARSE